MVIRSSSFLVKMATQVQLGASHSLLTFTFFSRDLENTVLSLRELLSSAQMSSFSIVMLLRGFFLLFPLVIMTSESWGCLKLVVCSV